MSDYLTQDELTQYVETLAADTSLWEHWVRHTPKQRQYTRLVQNDVLNAWLICWMEDHDTGFHDHNGSAGSVIVTRGTVQEGRLRANDNDNDVIIYPHFETYGEEEGFSFGPYDIHRVCHYGGTPAVTIHAYSPPLVHMGSYAMDGELRRLPMGEEEELKPLELAVRDDNHFDDMMRMHDEPLIVTYGDLQKFEDIMNGPPAKRIGKPLPIED